MSSDTADDGDSLDEEAPLRRQISERLPAPLRRNLTAKLLLLLVVGTAISGAVVVVSYAAINEEITDQVRAQVESDTTVQATVYENWLTERWTTLTAMTEEPEMEHESEAILHQWLSAKQTGASGPMESLHIADRETGEILGSTDSSLHDSNLYEMGLDRDSGNALLFVSREPIQLTEGGDEMTLIGTQSGGRLLVGTVPANTSLVESQAFEEATSSLYSLEGNRLLGTSPDETIDLQADMPNGTHIHDYGQTIAGMDIIAHDVLDAQPVEEYDENTTVGTVVVTQTPKNEAFAVREQITRYLFVALGLGIVLLIGTAAVSMRSVTADINRLSERARQVSEGSFDVDVSSDREDEIGTLYRSVEEMRDSLQERLQQVSKQKRETEAARDEAEEAREKLRQVIDLVPDVVFARNRKGEFIIANESTASSYGLSPDEVEGKTVWELANDEEQADEFHEEDLEVIESQEPLYIPEHEVLYADGESRIHETTKIPYQPVGSSENAVLGYARDVTERKQHEHRIERQRDNLKILNKMVRHDIRNDLQVILGYAERLDATVAGDDETFVDQILNSVRHAIEITTTAKDISEVMLDSESELVPVRFRRVLERELEEVRATHEHAVIETDGPLPDVRVLADELLNSVFRNLLKNAIDHNDKDVPRVAVSATHQDGRVQMRVADNGPGIRDARKEIIFEEGEQGMKSEGTGIGLYLVQTLVEQYGGDVWVEDNEEALGPEESTGGHAEGAVFVVEFRVADT